MQALLCFSFLRETWLRETALDDKNIIAPIKIHESKGTLEHDIKEISSVKKAKKKKNEIKGALI